MARYKLTPTTDGGNLDPDEYPLTLTGPAGAVGLKLPDMPSVTTILGDALPKGGGMPWWGYKIACQAVLEAVNNSRKGELFVTECPDGDALYEKLKKRRKVTPQTALKEAGARGTAVHDYAEFRIQGHLPTEPPAEELAGYLRAVDRWLDECLNARWEVVAVEQTLASLRYGFVGTTDMILRDRYDGRMGIADFKTSKAVRSSHKLQLAFYEQAAREMGVVPDGERCENFVVRLGDDGTYEQVPSYSTWADAQIVLAQYHMLKGMENAE